MALSRSNLHDRAIVATRIFLGLILFGAGMSKLYFEHQFPGVFGPVWLEEKLEVHGLGLYARFIAGSQIIAGLLLLTQRFSTLGAIVTFPILLNIFVVTVSLKWQGTPYINFFLLSLNAWLLVYDYHKLKFILTDITKNLKTVALERKSKKADIFWGLGILIILLSVPLSYIHLTIAWVLCGLSVIGILVNQLVHQKKE